MLVAAVVVRSPAGGEAGESSYAMFGVHELAPSGALLQGFLFLEPNEELELELSAASHMAGHSAGASADPSADSAAAAAPVRVRARVVRLDFGDHEEPGGAPGMEVAFLDLGEAERKRIEELARVAVES